MAKEGPISRYIDAASTTKPSGATVPNGSTIFEWDIAVLKVTPNSGSTWVVKDATPVEFLFRPGQAVLSAGMVAAGTRQYGETVSTTTVSGTTVWSSTITFDPYQSGLIDGLSVGGMVAGQLTLGLIAAASTPNAKLTVRVKNNSVSTWVTALALTGAIATTSVVAYRTYDIPYLKTEANFNAVPFDIAFGVQSDSSANSIQARLMESSYIQGAFIPGTV